MGWKQKYGWNRYIGALIRDTQDMPPGFRRNWKRLCCGLKLFLEHRGNLWDYQPEIDRMIRDGYVYTFTKDGKEIRLYLPAYDHDFIQRNIVTYGDFYEADELAVLDKEISIQGAIVLDIGANIGNHTVYWSKVREATHIYSFEPVPDTFRILKRNIELNALEEKVTLFPVALGNEDGSANLDFWDPNNCGKAQIKSSTDGSMKLARLDDFSFERIDFVKIDVETFEYHLLLGARETLNKHSPVIFVEIFSEHFERVNGLLEEYGYRMKEELSLYNYVYAKSADR